MPIRACIVSILLIQGMLWGCAMDESTDGSSGNVSAEPTLVPPFDEIESGESKSDSAGPTDADAGFSLFVRQSTTAVPCTAVSADAGGGPHVIVYGCDNSLLASFHAYVSEFRGGVRVALGDVNGDGIADLITTAGPGSWPVVTVFDGVSLAPGRTPTKINEFLAYNNNGSGYYSSHDGVRNCGLYVATGDFNGDGKDDIVASMGEGCGTDVRVFNGASVASRSPNPLWLGSFFAYPGSLYGARIAVGDADNDQYKVPNIVTAPGRGGPALIRVWEPYGGMNSQFALNMATTDGATVLVSSPGRIAVASGPTPATWLNKCPSWSFWCQSPNSTQLYFSDMWGNNKTSWTPWRDYKGEIRLGYRTFYHDNGSYGWLMTGSAPGLASMVQSGGLLSPFGGFGGGVFVAGYNPVPR